MTDDEGRPPEPAAEPPAGSAPPPPSGPAFGTPPPPPYGALPPYGAPLPGAATPVPYGSPADRVRVAWQRRHESDYVFDFWTALGWTLLTCGVYRVYVIYQLVRRSRDHNRRRIELLTAATELAWQRAEARGIAEELRPGFDRIGANLAVLHRQTTDFRDPVIWALLAFLGGGIADIVAYVLLDGDLIDHDRAEGAVEADLTAIYGRLGASVIAPDPARQKGRHNYVGRIIATLATCGLYVLWWTYDVMVEANRHFEHNWRWEDSLAAAVQSLVADA